MNDVRTWWHYPIEMPVNAEGRGPATVGKDAVRITYEVWDKLLQSHASFDNLPDAINEAMRLNVKMTEEHSEVDEDWFKRARIQTPAERARRYMGQIQAECDCPQPDACTESQQCLAINQTCRKCGGDMEAGYALEQTFTPGTPDFPGGDIITMSAGGPGRMVACRKCKACGWSVTV